MKRILITRESENFNLESCVGTEIKSVQFFNLPFIRTEPVKPLFSKNFYDFGIFTSPNSVKYFAPYKDTLEIGRFFAVGSVTAEKIQDIFNVAALTPTDYYLKDLLELFDGVDLQGKSALSPGAKKRIGDMSPYFNSRECFYEAVPVYKTTSVIYPPGFVDNFIKEHNITDIAFFSPSAAVSFFSQSNSCDKGGIKLYAIGSTTAEYVEKYAPECIIPGEQTMCSLITKILEK